VRGRGHPLVGTWGQSISEPELYIKPREDAYLAWAVEVLWLARMCVLKGALVRCICARVCAWGGVLSPEPVGCAGGRAGHRSAAFMSMQPEDLGRDRGR
jgi:hypothetical protein